MLACRYHNRSFKNKFWANEFTPCNSNLFKFSYLYLWTGQFDNFMSEIMLQTSTIRINWLFAKIDCLYFPSYALFIFKFLFYCGLLGGGVENMLMISNNGLCLSLSKEGRMPVSCRLTLIWLFLLLCACNHINLTCNSASEICAI